MMDITALWLTLKLALATSAVLLVIGLPIAGWLASTRSAWRVVVEAVVTLPLILPPTVIGFYVLIATSPTSSVGQFYGWLTGGTLPFSFEGILLASVIYNLPFAVRPFSVALEAVDQRLIEASWCLGASRTWTFLAVQCRLALPGLLAGMMLTFAHTIGEFGVVLMVGGNIEGVTRTLSIAIYDDVQALDYSAAGTTSIALVALSFALMVGTLALQRRGARG